MAAKIRAVVLVTLVTLLIWLWAEGESLSSTSFNPEIVIAPEGTELLVENDADWRGTVRVRMQGSTRALTQAESTLGVQIRLKLGQGGVPSQPGERQVVDLEEAIRSLPRVRELGLTVQEVTPAITVVKIVRLVTKELPVRAAMPTGAELLGDPVITPARVQVKLPEAIAAKLPVDASAVAPIGDAEFDAARDDTSRTVSTALQMPGVTAGAGEIQFIPEKVSVTFRRKRSVDSITLASTPVWFSMPPIESAKWNVEITDQFLRDVTFTGPADSIAKIRSREVVPIAEVRLSSDDLEKGVETKDAVFVALPPGVETGVAVKTVRVKITRRKADPGDTPPDRE